MIRMKVKIRFINKAVSCLILFLIYFLSVKNESVHAISIQDVVRLSDMYNSPLICADLLVRFMFRANILNIQN